MLLRRTTATAVVIHRFTTAKTRHHFLSTTAPKPFSGIPCRHRSKAIQESREALTDYLHATRSLPFLYADHIARNSPHSLSEIVSRIPFSPSMFACSFHRFLRYHPINELDFLFESIGLSYDEIKNGVPRSLLPQNTFFLSDWKQFDVVCALADMGFPWCKLGLLCKGGSFIFEPDRSELQRRVCEIKDGYGFDSVCVISICLAFPRVLYSKVDGLLADLKILFLDCDLLSSVEGNVDAVLEVCGKIKLFYDLGCEMGKVGELMGRSKCVFVEYSKEELISKIEFFCKFNVRKDQVGLLLLSRPEIFGFDLESRAISVSGFLKHFGMGKKELKSLEQKYPHVFGRNKIANVPRVMRSMDLGEWFFERMQNGDPALLNTYTILCTEDLDKHYADNLRNILAKRSYAYVMKKLSFLHSIGFGENRFAVKALAELQSNSSNLQQRFDCLLQCGIEYSKLCALVSFSARILKQKESSLEKKIEYLCKDMGFTLQYLDAFPGYLCYDLEKRIKPRCKFHKWLVGQGFCEKEYTLSTIIASSERNFVDRISRINRDAAKKWQENSLK